MSWRDVLAAFFESLHSARGTFHRPCYIALCGIKDWHIFKEHLSDDQMAQLLTWYQDVMCLELSRLYGWRVTAMPPSGDDDEQRACLTFGFHELADALAWALRSQDALLHAAWPEFVTGLECCQPIYHLGDDDVWSQLFGGLSVAIAINKQRIHSSVITVRRIHVLICGLKSLKITSRLNAQHASGHNTSYDAVDTQCCRGYPSSA